MLSVFKEKGLPQDAKRGTVYEVVASVLLRLTDPYGPIKIKG
ncbi:MAG TPA: hypothetical protein VEY10_21235 [Flavisolibacter sp.]|jgi:hypothetical protein|nr:hypothetical protein [Flavisolibacter sp.]